LRSPRRSRLENLRKKVIWEQLWHICSRQELWNQQRQPFLSNGFANKFVSMETVWYNNNGKWCFIRSSCQDVISRTGRELLSQLRVAVAEARDSSEPRGRERPPLGAVTRRLAKTQQAEKT
jgi:hypothetical protein